MAYNMHTSHNCAVLYTCSATHVCSKSLQAMHSHVAPDQGQLSYVLIVMKPASSCSSNFSSFLPTSYLLQCWHIRFSHCIFCSAGVSGSSQLGVHPAEDLIVDATCVDVLLRQSLGFFFRDVMHLSDQQVQQMLLLRVVALLPCC